MLYIGTHNFLHIVNCVQCISYKLDKKYKAHRINCIVICNQRLKKYVHAVFLHEKVVFNHTLQYSTQTYTLELSQKFRQLYINAIIYN